MEKGYHEPSVKNIGLVGTIMVVLICSLYGLNTVAVKICLSGVPPLAGVALRFIISVMVLWLWAIGKKIRLRIDRKYFLPLILLGLMTSAQFALFNVGTQFTSAARSAIFLNIQPVIVVLLAHFTLQDEKLTVPKVGGALLAFAGIYATFSEEDLGTLGSWRGEVIILGGAFCWAMVTIYTKKLVAVLHPLILVLYPLSIAAVFTSLANFALGNPLYFDLKPIVIGSLMYQGLIVSGFAMVVWNKLIHDYGASAISMFIFLIPVFGTIFGGLILNDVITSRLLLGLIMIASGIIIVNLRRTNKHATAMDPPSGLN